MTKTTKDGRKFTQSIVRPLLLRDLALKQTFVDYKRFEEMEMSGLGVNELHRLRHLQNQNRAMTDRTSRIQEEMQKSANKRLGNTKSRNGSRQSLFQDRQSPK